MLTINSYLDITMFWKGFPLCGCCEPVYWPATKRNCSLLAHMMITRERKGSFIYDRNDSLKWQSKRKIHILLEYPSSYRMKPSF